MFIVPAGARRRRIAGVLLSGTAISACAAALLAAGPAQALGLPVPTPVVTVPPLTAGVPGAIGVVLGGATTPPATGGGSTSSPIATSAPGSGPVDSGVGAVSTRDGVVTVAVPELATTATTSTQNGVDVHLLIGSTSTPQTETRLSVPTGTASSTPTGTLGSASIRAWSDSAYPYPDGYLDGFPVTVQGIDTDGSPLAVHGTATVSSGGRSLTTTFSDASGTSTFVADARDLPLGEGVLTVDAWGPNSDAPVEQTVPVHLLATAITAAGASTPYTTVYPVKDGYRDGVRFALSTLSTTGTRVPLHGSATITRGKQIVKRFVITAKTTALTWNGRVGKRVVPGKYLLRAVLAGPQGAAVVVDRTIRVSAQRLLVKKATLTVPIIGSRSAAKAMNRTAPGGLARCRITSTALVCSATRSAIGASSTVPLPSIQLPKQVLAGRKYGPLQVRFVATVITKTGAPHWIEKADGTHRFAVRSGKHAYPWVTVPKGSTSLPVSVRLGRSGLVAVTSTVIEYRYRKLS